MHIKIKNKRANLYRSRYVRKNAVGNTHGYSEQMFVGSLLLDSIDVPQELVALLSSEEVAYLHERVIAPARLAAQKSSLAQEAKRRDPVWRIDEAARLLSEAVNLTSSSYAQVNAKQVRALIQVCDELAVKAGIKADPLDAVVDAAMNATALIKAGHYGDAPSGNLRDTKVYKRWQRIREAIDSGQGSVLKALQSKGWARVRG
jgi:hypothetical protein